MAHKNDASKEKDILLQEKKRLTPNDGFSLVAIDYFTSGGTQLYLVQHFDMYKDALDVKKSKKRQDEYFILYKGQGGEYLCR